MSDQVERKLTAILAADVAGYSRLMAADEEGTLAALKAHRRELIDLKIKEYRGRIIKTTGDGMLVEFASVVDAVRCAVDVQRGMAARNADTPPDRRIDFRVGINIGDVIVDGDDIYGDGVNIAARLENIADPGGIRVSANVRDQVLDKLGFGFDDLGEQSLKNIARPVRVFSIDIQDNSTTPAKAGVPPSAAASVGTMDPGFRRGGGKRVRLIGIAVAALLVIAAVAAWYFLARPAARIAANAPAHLSIVVLPFANLSNDPKQDYFADGITDNLTTDLSRIRNSFVIARNTAFTYKGKSVDAKEIGKELGVRYVLEGSVQRDGNRVRVNAQLIDAESGAHLWANRFEEDLADLFKLQDDVVARLANTLGYELVKAAAARGAHGTNPDAIDLTMRGFVLFWGPPKRENEVAAQKLFDAAIKIDPNDDNALAGSAAAYFRDVAHGWTDPKLDYAALILGQADSALAINPNNAWAYYAKAGYLADTGRQDEAISLADAALARNPNFTPVRIIHAFAAEGAHRYEEARSDLLYVLKLSPRDPALANVYGILGSVEVALGNYAAAIEAEHKSLEYARTFRQFTDLAAALALGGKMEEAATALAEARRLNPKLTVKWLIANAPVMASAHALEGLRKAGLPEDEPPKHLSIVVLPFDNLSGDPKQDYFADGITDNLTTDLSRIRNSFVIARNTAFTFKGKAVDAKEIGKELGVRYVLEGSVQRDGNRVRVNAQLIDAESGSHLWADRFEEDLADLFKLQDDVVARLANTLGYELVNAEAQRAAHSTNPDAMDLTMQGWALNWQAPTKEVDVAARNDFERALRIDAANDNALSGIAYTYVRDFIYGWADEGTDYQAKLIQPADRAIAINPYSPMAYYAKSFYLSHIHRAGEALAVANAGLENNPSSSYLYLVRGIAEIPLRRYPQAKSDLNQSIHINPRDPLMRPARTLLANVEIQLGNYDAAINQVRQSIEEGYNVWPPYAWMAAALALAGRTEEARAALAQARQINAQLSVKWAMAHAIMTPALIDGLRKAGLPEDEGPRLSIVVLPFENIGDPAQAYIADAITEELTTALSRLRDSFVIARTTAMTYKGKPVDVKQIGKDLGVRYALEGSAQRGGDRVRVTAQLIDADTGAHLWADQFDQPRAELLDMQDEIVTRLGRALDLQLTAADIARAQRQRPGNLDAEDFALKCRSEFEQYLWEPSKLRTAFELCEKAIALDPHNAIALPYLAYQALQPVLFLRSKDPASDIRKATELVSRAIDIDPNSATAHTVNASIFSAEGRWEEAVAEHQRAIALNPVDIAAYAGICGDYDELARPTDAIECADKAMRVSPRDPFVSTFLLQKSWALLQLDRYDQAVVTQRSAIVLTPGEPLMKDQLAYNIIAEAAAAQANDNEKAVDESAALSSASLSTNANDFFARFVKARVLIEKNLPDDALAEMALIPRRVRQLYFSYHAECDAKALLGSAAETIACADKLIALGPRYQNLHIAYLDKGWALMILKKAGDAIAPLRQATAVRPSASFPKAFLAVSLALTGRLAESHEALNAYLAAYGVRMKTVASWRDYWNQWPTQNQAVLDFRKRFFDGLRKAGMPEN